MNVNRTLLDDGVSFRETGPSAWLVTVDGDERTITFDERGFIAWTGVQERHWCFDHALKACVDDARHHRFLRDRQQALQRAYDRRMAALSPEQFAYVLASREEELGLLDYSDSTDAGSRAAGLREEINAMKEFAR